ncbi:hypothetical protein N665_0417s0013 [Sinapis alba]|nr:hypothetical protein N665_0417s0013 [Sinapis alba]
MAGSKRNKGGEEGKEMITDSRFSSAHTNPRFRRLPRRESKVTIDSRFKGVLSDKASAPVDKRGKRRIRGSAKDSLKEYYRIEEDDNNNKKKKQKRKEDDESGDDDESEGEEKMMALEAEARQRKSEQSSEEEESDEEESKIPLKLASSDEESDESAESEEDVSEEEEVDTDEDDDEAMYEDDEPEVAEEEIASIEKETHRLAIVNMDWRYVSAKDLYVVFNSFLPKDGRLLSVAVYPSEFGLERMKEEEIHGPAIDGGDKKNEDNSDDEEEEDEDDINERLRDYEKSRLKYYFAVAECDSSATADYLYKSCDGIEFERSSNKLDLRFIPDSMEFKHPPRDIATEAPATYQGLDFQSQALQMSRVNVTWDEDEPHRVKTLNQRFNPDQLAELELKEFLASDESESDDDEDDDEEKRKEKYRALMESGDVDSDKDEDEEENDMDMEVKFDTGLEDLSNKFREKKEEKPETVWEGQLRKMREKKRARRMQKKDDDDDDDSSDDDGDDYSVDDHKKKKKSKKNKKGLEEKLAADERSLAELELIVADENGGDGKKGLKGYNIKGKGKKKSREMAEEKIPSADPDDQRFSVAFTDPNYALDPTNPQFKRSATYVKQLTQKQKEDPRSQEQVKDVETKKASTSVGSSKKRSFAESATVKSLKLKMQHKGSEKKKEGTTELAQRVKNKAKALSNK